MSKVKISEDVLEVLSRSEIKDKSLKLPNETLDRDLYMKVDKVIKLAGGKWNRSAKAHIFNEDPREKLGLALESGSIIDEKKERQAFYTPKALAQTILEYCDVEEKTVLEPSAGCGNLADACIEAGAQYVRCFEIDLKEADKLAQRYNTTLADFLTLSSENFGKFDRVVMNPPFTKNQWIKHIRHAMSFLNKNGILYSVTPNIDSDKLKDLNPEVLAVFDEKEFKESETMVATRLIKINKK